MFWTISKDPDFNGLHILIRDEFELDRFKRLVHEMLDRPDWRAGMATLWDYSEGDMSVVDFEPIQQASREHLHHDQNLGDGSSRSVRTACQGVPVRSEQRKAPVSRVLQGLKVVGLPGFEPRPREPETYFMCVIAMTYEIYSTFILFFS